MLQVDRTEQLQLGSGHFSGGGRALPLAAVEQEQPGTCASEPGGRGLATANSTSCEFYACFFLGFYAVDGAPKPNQISWAHTAEWERFDFAPPGSRSTRSRATTRAFRATPTRGLASLRNSNTWGSNDFWGGRLVDEVHTSGCLDRKV